MLIYLVGFMAVGKTTVGQILAKKLALPFFDLDEIVEKEAKKSIPAIFATEGEEGFRQRETDSLLTLPSRGVVATGGGVIQRAVNRKFLSSKRVVFLKADYDLLAQRVLKTPGNRPLADENFHRRFIEREPFYLEVADYVVETTGKSADQVAKEVLVWMLP